MPLAPRTAADAYAAAAQAFQEGKLEEARGLLAPWVTRAVPDARVHGLMGFVLRRMGDGAGAEQALKTARRLSPREAVYPHALGELFGVMGRSAESETAYREALAG